ncbi:fimbrial protein [Salmonella enterica]|nr:fimbrial protein [Salmonella enterica]
MNNITCGKMKKSAVRLTRVLSRRLSLLSSLWLLMVCVLAGPGYAYADCVSTNGQASIPLPLPPSASFAPGSDFKPYIGPPVTFNYKCTLNINPPGLPVALYTLGDVSPLQTALHNAGLLLKLQISDSSGGSPIIWDISHAGKSEYRDIGLPYTGTVERTMTVRVMLSRDDSVTAPGPGFYVVPSLSAFMLRNANGGSFTGLTLTTPAIRLQYVPTCFVKTSLNKNNINFGSVMTTDVNSSLSRSLPFIVTAGVNKSCSGYDSLTTYKTLEIPSTGEKKKFWLLLPLKASFVLNNGGEVSQDGKSILLYTNKNNEQQKNGLKLQITSDGTPVTFGEISSPGSSSANKFGEFNGDGSTWLVSKTYNAVLSSSGEQVTTGKYSAQITVKVQYY